MGQLVEIKVIDSKAEYSIPFDIRSKLALYKPGVRVQIEDGDFKNLRGTIVQYPDPYAVWVRLDGHRAWRWFYPEELTII